MNEVKKCSLSGVAFTMDVDAYDALAAYLESLNRAYGQTAEGAEIVADIEARIAELILSAQSAERVVEKPLILNIIRQMGSPEQIEEERDEPRDDRSPRIPRRLYRDMENAKLGGVCSGIGRYFDIDPVWVRMGLFLPLLLTCMGGLPFFGRWTSQLFSNLFGIFVLCYLIMWFAVPIARTARQKLEMNGERISAQSIRSTTEAAAAVDPDVRAKPVVAEAVSALGMVVLILLKIFAGLIVFGLIIGACSLIIGLFALLVGGSVLIAPFMEGLSLGVPVLGIFVVLIPIILLIYVLMCMIASRKPSGRSVLAIFLLWLLATIACSVLAVREHVVDDFRMRHTKIRNALDTELIIDGDTTTFEQLLEAGDGGNIVEENGREMHVRVPSRSLDITVDKDRGEMRLNADGREYSLRADEDDERVSLHVSASDAADGR